MACVLQNVVPAKYAFVLHTANPLTGDTAEMLGEVVLGLGETLVSNTPGRAFSFKCGRGGGESRESASSSALGREEPQHPKNTLIQNRAVGKLCVAPAGALPVPDRLYRPV